MGDNTEPIHRIVIMDPGAVPGTSTTNFDGGELESTDEIKMSNVFDVYKSSLKKYRKNERKQ